MSLGLVTPKQVADGDKKPNLLWHSYRTEAIRRNQEKVWVEFTQTVRWPTPRDGYSQTAVPLRYCANWANSIPNIPKYKKVNGDGTGITFRMAGPVWREVVHEKV